MQQSHHQGIFTGSTRFTPVQNLPVRPGIVPGSQKYIFAVPSSRFITVCPGRHTSTPGLINQDHPGGHPFHPGGHPVHPGDTRFIPVNTRFIPVNTRFITVPYGSLRVNTRFITVPYGALRFITGILTIPVNTRFITVHYGSSRSTPSSSRSTPGLNFLPGLMPVRPNYQTCRIF